MNIRCDENTSPPSRLLPLALLVISLGGCANFQNSRFNDGAAAGFQQVPVQLAALRLEESIPPGRSTSAARQLATEGIKAMDARNYAKANSLFNLALKTDINNSYLHFLNALTYHMRGLGGEGSLYGLAQQGYERAIEFDPSNTIARHQLGLLYMDRRDYPSAVTQLMEASLYAKDDQELLYDLAVASYYAKDSRTAYAALVGLRDAQKGAPSLRVLRASAIIAASTGDDEGARKFIALLRQAGGTPEQLSFTEKRVERWQDSIKSGMIKTQFSQTQPNNQGGFPQQGGLPQQGGFPQQGTAPQQGFQQQGVPQQGFGQPNNPGQFGGNFQSAAGGFFDKKMVMLDVVIVSTEEDNNDTLGVNLLDGLKIQFGSPLGNAAVSKVSTVSTDLVNAANNTSTQMLTRTIGLSAIAYTLNIANAQDLRNEVVARPSLVALGGQTSTFFSGTDVLGAAISTGQGGAVQVQKEAGVKLTVTPEFLPDNLIKMQIVAERTYLTIPNSNVLFDFRLDTSKTLVSANVAMKYGETLILSGLSERSLESSSSGVPVLRDVPIVQYLFNRKTKRDFYKSVLIIVTPRRPTYTNRSAEDIQVEQQKYSEFDRLQQEFENKYKLWFQPVPNFASTMKVLETSEIYREFRSGDMEIESWTTRSTHAGRLKAALQQLYF